MSISLKKKHTRKIHQERKNHFSYLTKKTFKNLRTSSRKVIASISNQNDVSIKKCRRDMHLETYIKIRPLKKDRSSTSNAW